MQDKLMGSTPYFLQQLGSSLQEDNTMLTWCQAVLSWHLGSIEAGTAGTEIWMQQLSSRKSPTALCAAATAAS